MEKSIRMKEVYYISKLYLWDMDTYEKTIEIPYESFRVEDIEAFRAKVKRESGRYPLFEYETRVEPYEDKDKSEHK